MKGNGFGRFMITNYLYKIKFTPTKKRRGGTKIQALKKIKQQLRWSVEKSKRTKQKVKISRIINWI